MVFIHGGAFQYLGSNAPILNSAYFASLGNVIVVTFNYRLGALICNSSLYTVLSRKLFFKGL